jgi:hypothetical protein
MSLASNPMRYSPAFHFEEFFDRYSDLGQFFDGAHISFAEILLDPTQDSYAGHVLYTLQSFNGSIDEAAPPAKRKSSSTSRKKHEIQEAALANSARKSQAQQIAIQQQQAQQQHPMLSLHITRHFQRIGTGCQGSHKRNSRLRTHFLCRILQSLTIRCLGYRI